MTASVGAGEPEASKASPRRLLSGLGGRVRAGDMRVIGVLVFVVALAARWWVIFGGSGLTGDFGYDQSVYYTAADALLHGHFPYHGDFVFVHPPVIMIVGLPFALLGRLTTDQIGYAAENLAFSVIGAANAVLVMLVARRWGLSRAGAIVGGLFCAGWVVSVAAESSLRLEVLGDLLLLLGLLTLARGRTGAVRPLLLTGVLFGLLIDVKLWWVAVVAVVLAATAIGARRVRLAVIPLAVAAGTALLVALPFLLVAGHRMVRSIVGVQVGRSNLQWLPGHGFVRYSTMNRLGKMTGADVTAAAFRPHASADGRLVQTLTVVVVLLFLVICASAARSVAGRIFVVTLAVQVAVLLKAPVYFPYYGDFVAISGGLVLAAAAGAGRTAWRLGLVWPVAALAGTTAVLATGGLGIVAPLPDHDRLAAATAGLRCIQADSPVTLIELNALDRSFANGCRNWVDFQGVQHGAGPDPAATVEGFRVSAAYRRVMLRYFESGDAVVVWQPSDRRLLGAAVLRRLESGPVIASGGGLTVYAVPRPRRATDSNRRIGGPSDERAIRHRARVRSRGRAGTSVSDQ